MVVFSRKEAGLVRRRRESYGKQCSCSQVKMMMDTTGWDANISHSAVVTTQGDEA